MNFQGEICNESFTQISIPVLIMFVIVKDAGSVKLLGMWKLLKHLWNLPQLVIWGLHSIILASLGDPSMCMHWDSIFNFPRLRGSSRRNKEGKVVSCLLTLFYHINLLVIHFSMWWCGSTIIVFTWTCLSLSFSVRTSRELLLNCYLFLDDRTVLVKLVPLFLNIHLLVFLAKIVLLASFLHSALFFFFAFFEKNGNKQIKRWS